MGTVKVTNLEPISSGGTLTVGASGDTVTFPAGVTITNNGSAAGFGKVLQVVQSTFTSSGAPSLTSTSFVAFSSLTASITPSSSSNKVLILLSTSVYGPSGNTLFTTIARGSTNLGGSNGFSQKTTANWAGATMVYLDSPSTTSSTSYTLYAKVSGGEGYMYGDSGNTNTIILMEIAG